MVRINSEPGVGCKGFLPAQVRTRANRLSTGPSSGVFRVLSPVLLTISTLLVAGVAFPLQPGLDIAAALDAWGQPDLRTYAAYVAGIVYQYTGRKCLSTINSRAAPRLDLSASVRVRAPPYSGKARHASASIQLKSDVNCPQRLSARKTAHWTRRGVGSLDAPNYRTADRPLITSAKCAVRDFGAIRGRVGQ